MSDLGININDMFNCGIHYGHKTSFSNPKTAQFVFAERNGLEIIDLNQTKTMFEQALIFMDQIVRTGGKVVFVGTKQSAQEIVAEYGAKMQMPYVDQRWLGGMLTNFKTVRSRVSRLDQLNKIFADGDLRGLTKKERLVLQRERAKLSLGLGGVQELHGLPEALFVIDVAQERIAIREANKLGIPVIGVVDTNCSPEGVDYIIPGNDDALSAIEYYMSCAASVIDSARQAYEAERSKVAKQALPKISKKTAAKPAKEEPAAEASEDKKAEVKDDAPKKRRVLRKKAEDAAAPAEEKAAAKEPEAKKPAVKKAEAKKPAAKKTEAKKPAAKKPAAKKASTTKSTKE